MPRFRGDEGAIASFGIFTSIGYEKLKFQGSTYSTNVVVHQSDRVTIQTTFRARCDLLTQLLHDNPRKSIRLYIAIFIRGLFNLLTGLYIVSRLAALPAVLLS